MREEITRRFEELIADGDRIISRLPVDNDGGFKYWLPHQDVPAVQAWIASVGNLIAVSVPINSPYLEETRRLLGLEHMQSGVPSMVVLKLHGQLQSAATEWATGLLRRIEYIVAGETFDDFLDMADEYYQQGKKIEGAVLACAVFEDTIAKICQQNNIDPSGKTLDPLISALAAAQVISGLQAKRFRYFAGVRNHALHAEWDSIDQSDVGDIIGGLRDLIESHL